MENNRFLSLFELPEELPGIPASRRNLYRLLQSTLTYVPILLGFNFIGFVIIYLLGTLGLLGQGDLRLLLVGIISLLAGLMHLPFFSLLRQGRLESTTAGLLLVNVTSTVLQTLLWENIAWFLVLQAAGLILVFAFQKGLRTPSRIFSLLFGVLMAAMILYIDRIISFQRLSLALLAQMAAFTIYLTIIMLIVLLVAINSLIKFNTISARLVVTFTIVTTLAAFSTLVISAISGLFRDQQKVTQQLNLINNLKQEQIQATLTNLDNNLQIVMQDLVITQRMRFLFRSDIDPLLYQFNNDLVRKYLAEIRQNNPNYEEVLLIDGKGMVIFSTVPENETRNFSQLEFFKQAQAGRNYHIDKAFPRAQGTSLLIFRQIVQNDTLLGILVARANFEIINDVMKIQAEAGETLDTYIVGPDSRPLTNTRNPTAIVQTDATEQVLKTNPAPGSGLYTSYAGIKVLGYYSWIPELQVAVITEIEQQEVVQGILLNLLSNLVVGLFTIGMAFVIVFFSSRTISKPIANLAEKVTLLASGELGARISVDRQDEIGTLASGFNTMASEFQNLVKTLELKVEDRTKDLQKQANRLRLASEVARDANTARNMVDLLNRSAQLVQDRFSFYHTGIYLLDPERQYAVLRASPTPAGQQMISDKFRIKVGEVSIVGFVAATGRPRIALDTGHDTTYAKHPLLSQTRSEMALPLKLESRIIGILDVQSELPDAFTQDDVAVLQIMADQLALAIDRVQLVQELEESIKNNEVSSQKFTISSWRNFIQEQEFKIGYKYDGMKITALESFPPETQEVFRRGRSVQYTVASMGEANDTHLAVPLKLRDQIIGILNICFLGSTISQETTSLVEEAANRLAVSLENARLYTETQSLAQRERMVSEITARIAASTNVEKILRTTVQELGDMLPDAEVTVEIQEGKR